MLSLRVATPGNLPVSKLAHSETSKAKLSYGQAKASIGNHITNLAPTNVGIRDGNPNLYCDPKLMPTILLKTGDTCIPKGRPATLTFRNVDR